MCCKLGRGKLSVEAHIRWTFVGAKEATLLAMSHRSIPLATRLLVLLLSLQLLNYRGTWAAELHGDSSACSACRGIVLFFYESALPALAIAQRASAEHAVSKSHVGAKDEAIEAALSGGGWILFSFSLVMLRNVD